MCPNFHREGRDPGQFVECPNFNWIWILMACRRQHVTVTIVLRGNLVRLLPRVSVFIILEFTATRNSLCLTRPTVQRTSYSETTPLVTLEAGIQILNQVMRVSSYHHLQVPLYYGDLSGVTRYCQPSPRWTARRTRWWGTSGQMRATVGKVELIGGVVIVLQVLCGGWMTFCLQ